MNILDAQQKILEFCSMPRTLNEIVEMLDLSKRMTSAILKNLTLSKQLIKHGSLKKRSVTFTKPSFVFIKPVDVPRTETNNFYAHNPFGLRA
jgi:DNA-binding transcriptional regulator GbsR (MarR family)